MLKNWRERRKDRAWRAHLERMGYAVITGMSGRVIVFY
jgi:hypothetical protein